MSLTPEQEERLARFNHYPHPEVTEADVALFVAALATEKAAREAAEAEAADERELCSEALRDQGRFRQERDDEHVAHERTRAELELAQAGLLSELEGKAVLEADLATARARVAELEREARLESGEADHYCNRLEAAESALALARTALKQASAEHPHWPGWEPLIAALSTTPTQAPVASPCAECEQLRKRVAELEAYAKDLQRGIGVRNDTIVALHAKLDAADVPREPQACTHGNAIGTGPCLLCHREPQAPAVDHVLSLLQTLDHRCGHLSYSDVSWALSRAGLAIVPAAAVPSEPVAEKPPCKDCEYLVDIHSPCVGCPVVAEIHRRRDR